MRIEFHNISKRYTRRWIIRNMSYEFEAGQTYAVVGDNGSGKSTLLKMIAGYLSPSVGHISFLQKENIIKKNEIFRSISFSAPYVKPLAELSINEMLQFYCQFKPLKSGVTDSDFHKILQLPVSPNHIIKNLSSGQQQRISLALAVLADTPILLLDEPGSYLDESSRTWMNELISHYSDHRITIIASNDKIDLLHTKERINIKSYQ